MKKLDEQIQQAGFWSAVLIVATTLISVFLPLDVPNAYEATLADRVDWLNANSGLFILSWTNQIASMLALSAMLAAMAWYIARWNPLRALLSAILIAFATMAFLIPKFIAVWTIPMLSEAIATQSTGYEMAQGLLPLLNVTVPYSLYTSFDFLGFWLYSVFALLVCIPMTRGPLSAKIIGIVLGLFGVIYNVLVAFILAGSIGRPQISDSLMAAAAMLLVATIAAFFLFRSPATIQDKGSA
ncbi:MAG: hypothetical protein CL917_05355 [Deltaproteobacteria bacterium]|nr:hypothetical protein [Deltaproteobacteria bacterium]